MAHKKGTGTTGTNRDSVSKRLGIKRFGGAKVGVGSIILRQKGNRFYPGEGTRLGNDFTIYAVSEGKVQFSKRGGRNIVSVNG